MNRVLEMKASEVPSTSPDGGLGPGMTLLRPANSGFSLGAEGPISRLPAARAPPGSANAGTHREAEGAESTPHTLTSVHSAPHSAGLRAPTSVRWSGPRTTLDGLWTPSLAAKFSTPFLPPSAHNPSELQLPTTPLRARQSPQAGVSNRRAPSPGVFGDPAKFSGWVTPAST